MKVELKAKAIIGSKRTEIDFEFGASQALMSISKTGTHARKLKLKNGDKVLVSIEKV